MRVASLLSVLVLLRACPLWAVDAADVTFKATFEGTLTAQSAKGSGKPETIGEFRFAQGHRGQGVVVGKEGNRLSYPVAGNVTLPEGTVSVWVQPIDWYGGDAMFHIFFDAAAAGGRLLLYEYGPEMRLKFYVRDPKGAALAANAQMSPDIWTPGSWHHLVSTWKPGEIAFYTDGKLAQRITGKVSLPTDLGERFLVGTNPGWNPITGRDDTVLDDLTLYNRALLPDEVAGLYRGEEFPKPAPLHISVASYPVAGTVGARIDARGAYSIPLEELSARVTLTKAKRTNVLREAVQPLKGREDEIELPTDGLHVGRYEVHVTLLHGQEEVAVESAPFSIPRKPEWWNNKLGITREVPPPWTPLKVEGDSVSCWGRRYDFAGSPVLGQIMTQEREILAGPIELTAELDGRRVRVRGMSSHVSEKADDRVVRRTDGTLGPLTVGSSAVMEYDGFVKFELVLAPSEAAAPPRVSKLGLVIPLKREHAQLMVLHGCYISGMAKAGAVPEDGFASPFKNFVLLGDNDRGLCWCTESDQYWYADEGSKGRQIEIVPRRDRVELRLNFISIPREITEPLRYVFALQATPVKPLPDDYRRLRMGYWTPKKPATILVPWSGWSKLPGYPVPADAENFDQFCKQWSEFKVCPYLDLHCTASESYEFRHFGEEWKILPEIRAHEQSPPRLMLGVNPGTGWGDFLIWQLDKLARRGGIGGIYLDIAEPVTDRNFRHGAGWQGEDGVWHGTGTIFAARECLKRLYEVFRRQDRRMIIILHQSGHVTPPTFSFADIYVNGEQLAPRLKDDYFDFITLDYFRACFMGKQWGIVTAFLPEWGRYPDSRHKDEADAVRHTMNTLALVGLHDCALWNAYLDADTADQWWRAQDQFGVENAEFIPYWDNARLVEGLPETVKVSAYVKPGGAFLTVTNMAKREQTIVLRLRPKALGGIVVTAKDVFSDEALPVRDGAIELTVPARLCRIVVVEAGP